MIKSLTFKKGGYITETTTSVKLTPAGEDKIEEYKKKKGEDSVQGLSEDGLIRHCKLVKGVDYKSKNVPLNPHLHKTLLNRTFEFSTDKINVIFGPNASGKSTIIKGIAGYCGCGSRDNLDGWTSNLFTEPLYIRSIFDTKEKNMSFDEYFPVFMEKRLNKLHNKIDVEWDGVPVYNDNFSSRRGRSIGDLCGSIFDKGDDLSEILYSINQNRISLGQNSIFIFNKVIGIVSNPYTFERYIQNAETSKKKMNDVWAEAVDFNVEFSRYHYSKYKSQDQEDINTVMFDELDKSLDIANTAFVYQNLLPGIIKQSKIQIILVSHSPLILTDEVIENTDVYNVISMDEEYTKKCRKTLKNFKFC